MKQNNNEQIVFDMFEEVATESIAEARNAYTYEEIDGCYQEAKEIAKATKRSFKDFYWLIFLILIVTMKTNADMENVDCKSTLKQDTEGALYIAHSENCYGELQTMKQHSEGVARMMKSFALSGEIC